MSKEAASEFENGEKRLPVESPFQKDQVEAAFARILSASGVEIALEVGYIKREIDEKFMKYISQKEIDLDDLRARKIECVTALKTILNNDSAGKFQQFENLFNLYNKKLDSKIEKAKKKLGIDEPEKAIDLKEIPDLVVEEIPVDEPAPLFPPTSEPEAKPEETKTEVETPPAAPEVEQPTVETPAPIFDEKVEEAEQNANETQNDVKTDETPQDQPENQEENKNTKEDKRLHITTLDNLTTFIKDSFPKIDKQITPSQGKYIINSTITVLEKASEDAKSKGKEEILALIQLADEFQQIMESVETKDIRENSKANLAQDISKELTSLKRALNRELSSIERQTNGLKEVPELNTFEEVEALLNKDLVDSKILPGNIKDLHAKIYEIIDTTTIKAEEDSEKSVRALGNKLIAIEKNLKQLVSRDKNKIKTKEQEELVKDLLSTFNFIFAKIDAAIKNFAKEEEKKNEKKEKKEKTPSRINSIKGIINFVTKKLADIPEIELVGKKQEISNAFTTEFDNLREDDEPSALILRGEILRLRQALDSSSFQGAKAELIKTLSGITEEFLKAIKRKSETSPVDKENNEASREKKDPQQNSSESNIENLIAAKNGQFVEQASAEIKKDKNFNIWLQKIHDRSVKEEVNIYPRTWSEWHVAFKEQQVLLEKYDALFKSPQLEEKLYGNFESKEDREAAKRIKREMLSFDLIVDDEEMKKLKNIIELDENIKSHESSVKKIEQEKAQTMKDYEANKMTLPEDVFFKAIEGDKADIKRIEDFEGFLTDMSLNYDHYRILPKHQEENPDELADMFALYNKSKKGPYQYSKEKISKPKRLWNKIKFTLSTKDSDFDDKQTFMGKIKALRGAGVLDSKNSEGVDTEKNMRDLLAYVKLIKNSVQNGAKIEDFLATSTDEREKALFLAAFPKYTKSIVENHRLQSQAKTMAKKNELFESIEGKLTTAKTTAESLKKQQEEALTGSEDERAEFEELLNQELADEKLSGILKKIDERKMDPIRLQKLYVEFDSIPEDYAEQSLYRRVTLRLSKEEVALATNGKNIEINAESIARFDAIFESDEFSTKEKLDFAQAALDILNKKVTKLTSPTDTVERIDTNNSIKYFVDKKLSLK